MTGEAVVELVDRVVLPRFGGRRIFLRHHRRHAPTLPRNDTVARSRQTVTIEKVLGVIKDVKNFQRLNLRGSSGPPWRRVKPCEPEVDAEAITCHGSRTMTEARVVSVDSLRPSRSQNRTPRNELPPSAGRASCRNRPTGFLCVSRHSPRRPLRQSPSRNHRSEPILLQHPAVPRRKGGCRRAAGPNETRSRFLHAH